MNIASQINLVKFTGCTNKAVKYAITLLAANISCVVLRTTALLEMNVAEVKISLPPAGLGFNSNPLFQTP